MKKLGFGCMRLPLTDPNDHSSVNMDEFKEMVDIFIENGYTYFDTAIMYQNFASQKALKEALTSRYPRDKYTVATKLHADFFDSFEDRDKVFGEQLEQVGVDYFDYYLIHGVGKDNLKKYEDYDCFKWMFEKKKQGFVKHAGFSFHDKHELLEELLDKYPETEFVQLQINYLDWENEWVESRANYEVCRAHNKPVFVMEPVKGGTLASVPEKAEENFKALRPDITPSGWALLYAASLEDVEVVLSGMSNLSQLKENVKLFNNFDPLSKEEKAACLAAADEINSQIAIPCTGCSYCTEGCPEHIAIPQYFSLYNDVMREDMEKKGWTVSYGVYESLTKEHGKASNCIECGQCESICPQHLTIIEDLKKVAGEFERE